MFKKNNNIKTKVTVNNEDVETVMTMVELLNVRSDLTSKLLILIKKIDQKFLKHNNEAIEFIRKNMYEIHDLTIKESELEERMKNLKLGA